jgi:hypothetical protein
MVYTGLLTLVYVIGLLETETFKNRKDCAQ